MRRYSVNTTIKSSGDGEVATVAGEVCRWKLLVMTLRVGGPGVTVVWSSTLEVTVPYVSCQDVRAALLSPNGEGNIKGFLKKLTPIRLVRKPRQASHPTLRSKRYNKYMHMECENVTR